MKRKPKSISNLIRKLRLTMTSKSGQQVITIHICLNILRSIGHQALKFCQLIKYKVKKKILPNHTEKEESRKASEHLFCLPKA